MVHEKGIFRDWKSVCKWIRKHLPKFRNHNRQESEWRITLCYDPDSNW